MLKNQNSNVEKQEMEKVAEMKINVNNPVGVKYAKITNKNLRK